MLSTSSLFVREHLGCSHFLTVVNGAAVNIMVNKFYWIIISSEYMSRSDIAGSCGNSIYSFFGNLCTFLHSGYINLLSCQRCRRVLFPLHPLQHLLFVDFLVLALLQLSLSSMFHFLLLPFALCPSGSPWKVMCPRVLLLLFQDYSIPFSRESSLPRDWTQISCIAGKFFTVWATREAHYRIQIYFSYYICDWREKTGAWTVLHIARLLLWKAR